jgi:ketosteroid isomerase-like protein
MSNRSNSEQSKTVVDAYYQAGVEGCLREFARYLHPDFTTTAPNYLPWGGFHQGAAFLPRRGPSQPARRPRRTVQLRRLCAAGDGFTSEKVMEISKTFDTHFPVEP